MPADLNQWVNRRQNQGIDKLEPPGKLPGKVQDEQGEQSDIFVVELEQRPLGKDDELTILQRHR